MVTLPIKSARNNFRPSFASSRSLPDAQALREQCCALLTDVPASDRRSMLERLERLRRADDVWHLRTAMFDTIARAHGETVARHRLAALDAHLG
jgi:hypothetical protein